MKAILLKIKKNLKYKLQFVLKLIYLVCDWLWNIGTNYLNIFMEYVQNVDMDVIGFNRAINTTQYFTPKKIYICLNTISDGK